MTRFSDVTSDLRIVSCKREVSEAHQQEVPARKKKFPCGERNSELTRKKRSQGDGRCSDEHEDPKIEIERWQESEEHKIFKAEAERVGATTVRLGGCLARMSSSIRSVHRFQGQLRVYKYKNLFTTIRF